MSNNRRYNPDHYGYVGTGSNNGMSTSARVDMPTSQDMGGTNPDVPAFVRSPYYPTAPFYSTNPNVAYQTRFYSTGLISTDTDYAVNSEAIRRVQFDLPCRLIAVQGSVQTTEGTINRIAGDPRDTFLISLSYTTGDQILIGSRLGSTIVGSADSNFGELGGTGYSIQTGSSLSIGLTPLFTDLRIDIVLVCLEMRGATNYHLNR